MIPLAMTLLLFALTGSISAQTPAQTVVHKAARTPWAPSTTPPTSSIEGKIVNGVVTSGFPSVGLFVNDQPDPQDPTSVFELSCTVTLIGCSTALTAAHCICDDAAASNLLTGAQCVKRADLLDASMKLVYFHQAGIVRVSSVTVNPDFVFGEASDFAILHLATPVTGIAPSPLDTTAKPAFGTTGTLVGYGITEDPSSGGGIKRSGEVKVASCAVSGINAANHVCASLLSPLGTPGLNSGTCHGDSGGPLFVDSAAGPAIAGTTSGGDSSSDNCTPPDHIFFADVFKGRAWIEANAPDLGTAACGGLPAAGGPNTTVTSAAGSLNPGHSSELTPLNVPSNATRLRVGLTADNFDTNDYNLYVKQGSPATTTSYDCKSDGGGTLAFCDIQNPAAGPWYALVNGIAGPGGAYQLISTLYTQALAPTPCVPSAATLCLDDQPGDKRFKVEVLYQTSQGGGLAGNGNAIPLSPLGVNRGGLFWFFSADNPEMLVKVLNACSTSTPSYWVFYSAGTNVGFSVTVTDSVTGRTKTYSNPDLTSAPPVTDTSALPCS
jgi:hypothetical protein